MRAGGGGGGGAGDASGGVEVAVGGPRQRGAGGGALAALTDVLGAHRGPGGGPGGTGAGALDVEEDVLVGAVVDWVVAAAPAEADAHQRALMRDVVRLGIDGFALLGDPADEELFR